MAKRSTPTQDEAEAEFVRICAEIARLEKRAANLAKRVTGLRKRAEKLAHYIEIARNGVGKATRKSETLRPGQPKLQVFTDQ